MQVFVLESITGSCEEVTYTYSQLKTPSGTFWLSAVSVVSLRKIECTSRYSLQII
jgi:hypothetical protein